MMLIPLIQAFTGIQDYIIEHTLFLDPIVFGISVHIVIHVLAMMAVCMLHDKHNLYTLLNTFAYQNLCIYQVTNLYMQMSQYSHNLCEAHTISLNIFAVWL